MRFYKDFLVSDKIKLTRDEIKEKIIMGEVLFHTYLVVIPFKNQDHEIEYFHAEIARQEYYRAQDYLVVGVALGKSDATEMVCQIIEKIYTETNATEIKQYFINKC